MTAATFGRERGLGLAVTLPSVVRRAAGWLADMALALLLPGALVLGTLWAWHEAAFDFADRQGKAEIFDKLTIAPASADRNRAAVFTLGRRELRQNDVNGAAADRHVRIHRHADGRWQISNASTRRQLVLRYSDRAEYRSSRQMLATPGNGTPVPLVEAVRLTTKGAPMRLDLAQADRRRLAVTVTPDGGRSGQAAPAVYVLRYQANGDLVVEQGTRTVTIPASFVRGLRDGFRLPWGDHYANERVLARFGGDQFAEVNGVAVLPVPGYEYDGLRLVWLPRRGFAFAPGWDGLAEYVKGGERWRSLDVRHDLVMPVNSTADKVSEATLVGFTAGRTRYAVEWATANDRRSGLVIKPTGDPHRYRPQDSESFWDEALFEAPGQILHHPMKPVPALRASWSEALQPKASWAVLGALALAGWSVMLALRRRLARHELGDSGHPWRESMRYAALWGCAAAACALALGTTVSAGGWLSIATPQSWAPAPPQPAWVAWACAAAAVFLARGSSGLARFFFACATGLVATGSIVLLAMAVSADELRWARFHAEATSGIAIGAAIIAIACALPTGFFHVIGRTLSRPGRRGPVSIGFVLVCLLCAVNGVAWFLFGGEAGIPGLGQPSEAIKTIFVVILAALATLVLSRSFGGRVKPGFLAILLHFAAVGAVLLAVCTQPILANDFSPFLILSVTTLVALPAMILFSMAARASARRSTPFRADRPPRDPTAQRGVSAGAAPPLLTEAGIRARRWTNRLAPHVVEIAILAVLPLLLGILAVSTMRVVADANTRAAAQKWLEEDAPSWARKPAKRGISWLELALGRTAEVTVRDGVTVAPPIEYADTGLQVMRSRAAIAHAPCRVLPVHVPLRDAPVVGLAAAWVSDHVDAICPNRAARAPLVSVADLELPEIQNDFIAAWVFQALGRDGAFLLMLLQGLTIVVMAVIAFRSMRWRSGDEGQRVASTFYANCVIGFMVVLLAQFAISWMNAFGLLPVMGQPMTYVSQGRSHFLAFGVMAVIAPLIALRLQGGSRTAPTDLPRSGPPPRLRRWDRLPPRR